MINDVHDADMKTWMKETNVRIIVFWSKLLFERSTLVDIVFPFRGRRPEL